MTVALGTECGPVGERTALATPGDVPTTSACEGNVSNGARGARLDGSASQEAGGGETT
jgi:hypothetical protein